MTLSAPSPELFGISVAIFTLGATILGIAVTLGKHWLDGGRPKVYLNAAIWEPNTTLTVNRSGAWEASFADFEPVGEQHIELAQLVVENPGRTAITVYTPSLSVKGTHKRDYKISPRSYALRNFGADNSTSATSLRIEPYDRVTFLFDYWPAIQQALADSKHGSIRLRGCVHTAGRTKPQMSSSRRSWKIRVGDWTSQSTKKEISPYTILWQELFRANVTRESGDEEGDTFPGILLAVTLRKAMNRFTERPSAEEFEEALSNAGIEYGSERFQYLGIFYGRMDEILDRHQGRLSPWRPNK